MKKCIFVCICFLMILHGFSQTGSFTLTFVGVDALTQNNIPLESVYIQNTTLGCDTIIYGSSPSFQLKNSLGIPGHGAAGSPSFTVTPPSPNPFNGTTTAAVRVNSAGQLRLTLRDIRGTLLSEYKDNFGAGLYKFAITSSAGGILILTVTDGTSSTSVKLVSNGSADSGSTIVCLGMFGLDVKSVSATTFFSFRLGDQLLYKSIKTGYYDKIITDNPNQNSTYTFQLNAASGVIASFTYQADAVNPLKVTFTNYSQNATSYLWNFGDNSATVPDVNPVHVFPAFGSYTVQLTATSSASLSDTYHATVVLADPNPFLSKLTGTPGNPKTWKLIRSVATGRYPLECGPWDHSTKWWAMGFNNNELANRPCMLNDTWTFGRDGSLVFDTQGDYWAEGGIFNPANICASTSTMVGVNGENLSAWGSGTHTFALTPGAQPTLTARGNGAYVGFYKLGNQAETKIPLDSVKYNIVKLTDGDVDTLIIEGQYKWDLTDGGYWRFVLMHYDDPSQEPPIPGNPPTAGFTYSISGQTVTFTNTTTGGNTYLWDFGDGQSSNAQNPVHTFAGGPFTVTMTATNLNGSSVATAVIFVSTATITNALLQGAAWKVHVSDKSVFVGSGLGKSDWWSVSIFQLTMGTGADDWTCMPDDEFQFSTGGIYSYKTNGNARNDGYFGSPNGCFSDAQIAASGYGASFGTAIHSYTLTPASGGNLPTIKLTNGAGHAAFIGFYKGFNGIASGVAGGENTDNAQPPNAGSATNTYTVMGYANTGTKEYLFVSVDITAAHDGSAAWSAILKR